MTKKKLLQVRKKLFTDFSYYSKNSLKIRTKSGEVKPLVLNAAQQILQNGIEKQIRAETPPSSSPSLSSPSGGKGIINLPSHLLDM